MNKPVVIRGAGSCGLAAARDLLEGEQAVVILERAPFVGGMGATQQCGRDLFDAFQMHENHFYEFMS